VAIRHNFAIKAGLAAALAMAAALSTAAPPGSPRASTSNARPAASAPAPAQPFALTGILRLDRPLDHGDYVWEPQGVAAGPLRIVVDVAAQVIYVYRGGTEIGRAAILYGANGKPTPFGSFPILQKRADHVSNLYNAPMPWMMRLTWDGVAIHGSNVRYGYGTRGCVGVPEEFAQLLFAEAKVGDRVMITERWRTDVYPA